MPAGAAGALAPGPGPIFLQLYSEPTAEPANSKIRFVQGQYQDI